MKRHPLFMAHIGVLLVGLPIPLLLIPAQTPTGGIPGLAALLFLLTGWPPGAIVFALNMLCLGFARLLLGPKGALESLYSSLTLAAVVEFFYQLVPLAPVSHPLWPWAMQACASVLIGTGLALLVEVKYTPAGTAILSVILHRFTGLRVIVWLVFFDICITAATTYYMGLTTGLRAGFGIITMYPVYAVVERWLLRHQRNKASYSA